MVSVLITVAGDAKIVAEFWDEIVAERIDIYGKWVYQC